MKKKWILIALLVLIVLINPKKMGSFSDSLNKKSMELENIQSVNINKNFDSIEYNGNLVYYNDNVLKSISKSGKEVFSLKLNIKDLRLESNKFIDILDKEKNIVYSIDKDGKVILKKNMSKGGLLYKSINNDSYLYAYTKENKDMVNIYDYELKLVKSISLQGKVTDIDYSDKGIYISSINTENKLASTIAYYDYNGNLKNTKDINESIVLDIILDKQKIYLIEKNKISKLNPNLKVLDEFEVKDIKNYSNIYKDSIYVIESDGKIKFIDKDIENIKLNEVDLKGIVNVKDSFIAYTHEKIINKKGLELKKFEENIKNVFLIQEHTLVVELDTSMQIINIK